MTVELQLLTLIKPMACLLICGTPKNLTFSLGRRVRLSWWTWPCLLHVDSQAGCHTFWVCLGLHRREFRFHPNCDRCFFCDCCLLQHWLPEYWCFSAGYTLFWRCLMSNHTEVCTFRHGDGYRANQWRFRFHGKEGWLEKPRKRMMMEPKNCNTD